MVASWISNPSVKCLHIAGVSPALDCACYAEDIRRLESSLYGLTKGRCSRRDAMSFGKTKQD